MANGPIGTAALLHDWRSLLLGEPALPMDRVWVVRRDWPDGTHELISPRRSQPVVRRAQGADASYWRHGPMRPRLSLVRLTLAEFRSHPRGSTWCRSATCPTADAATLPVVSG